MRARFALGIVLAALIGGLVLFSPGGFSDLTQFGMPVPGPAGRGPGQGDEAVLGAQMTPEAGAQRAAVPPPPSRGQHAPDEMLVQFRPGATDAEKADARARVGANRVRALRTLPMPGRGELELVRIPPGLAVADAARGIQGHPAVVFAEPNWIYTPQQSPPTDSYYVDGSLWGLYGPDRNDYGSDAAGAWAAGATGGNVYVGVVDEGIEFEHPDLAPNIWQNPDDPANGIDDDGNGYVDDVHGWDFVNNDSSVYDGGRKGNQDAHGTHVAGTIGAAANNGGVVGVNWTAKMISVKFLGPRGGTLAAAVEGIDYITNLKKSKSLPIVATNNSWGGGGFSQALVDAIARAGAENILFIAAAGNGGTDNDVTASFPASYADPQYGLDNVIAVAAIDASGNLAGFSQWGARSVLLGAPGVDVLSTVPVGKYAYYSGTSMATPHVTGAAALYAARHPEVSAVQLKNVLAANARKTTSLQGKTITGGRLTVVADDRSAADDTAPVISGVAASGVTASGATIAWTTDDPSSSVVRYATAGGAQITVTGADGVTRHSVALSGLTAETTYDFTVESTNAAGLTGSATGSFVTAALGVHRPNAGGPAVGTFAADYGASGGGTFSTTHNFGDGDLAVYQTERYGTSFTYRFTGLPAGQYTVTLRFAEIYWTRRNQRVFDVAINGETRLRGFDIFAEAGANTPIDKTYADISVPANGEIRIDFTASRDNAKVSAIEIRRQ